MQNKKMILTSQQKGALLQALIGKYATSPEALEKTLPEVARILASLRQVPKRNASVDIFQLTPVERQRRQESLRKALDKLSKVKGLSREEAIQALEDAAALIGAFPFEPLALSKQDIAKLIKQASGLSVTTKGKLQTSVLREGEQAREAYLLRGVKLNLTWDKKLLSIEINPKELAVRAKALSIIGIGSDTATDVAARHDDYFVEAINGR